VGGDAQPGRAHRMNGSHVVVVGGGLAGLAAAIRSADDGARVTLVERAPRLGGATWSFTSSGLTYDNGQHVFMRCCTEYRTFLDRVGSSGKVTLQDRMDVPVLRRGGSMARLRRVRLPAPLHLAPALATYRHLSVVERLRAVRVALALRRLDLGDDTLDQVTFGTWLSGHGGRSPEIAALWDLVCRPTVNLPAEEASLLLAAKVYKTGLLDSADGGDIGWSNVPLQQLHGDAARRVLDELGVGVRLGAKVTAVGSADGGPTVTVDGEAIGADAVVVAVPHDAVDDLLGPNSFDQQAAVADLGRSPIVNVHLLYDRRVMTEPFAAGLDSPVQFVFDRTASSGAPAGHQMLAISLSAGDEYLPRKRDDLVAAFTGHIADLFPAAQRATVVASMVTRETAATFRGQPGSAAARPGPSTRLPGVFLAGAWTDTGWPATMEGAVRSGIAAVAAVRHHLTTYRAREDAA
jgi:squalene-associated FAD-dependent desaturase